MKAAVALAVAGVALGWYVLVVLSLVLSVGAFALSVETRRQQRARTTEEAQAAIALTVAHGGAPPPGG